MFGPVDLYAPNTQVMPAAGWVSSIFPHRQEVGDQVVIELNIWAAPLRVCMMAGTNQPHGATFPAVAACYKDLGVLAPGVHHIHVSATSAGGPGAVTWTEAAPVDPVNGPFGVPLTKHVIGEIPPPWFGFVVSTDNSDPEPLPGVIQGSIWYYEE